MREDIRSCIYDCDAYPIVKEELTDIIHDLEDKVPETLLCFTKAVINPKNNDTDILKRKSLTIAHAIVAATRPRSCISSLLRSIAVYIHRTYGSEDLIQLLNTIGLS